MSDEAHLAMPAKGQVTAVSPGLLQTLKVKINEDLAQPNKRTKTIVGWNCDRREIPRVCVWTAYTSERRN